MEEERKEQRRGRDDDTEEMKEKEKDVWAEGENKRGGEYRKNKRER